MSKVKRSLDRKVMYWSYGFLHIELDTVVSAAGMFASSHALHKPGQTIVVFCTIYPWSKQEQR